MPEPVSIASARCVAASTKAVPVGFVPAYLGKARQTARREPVFGSSRVRPDMLLRPHTAWHPFPHGVPGFTGIAEIPKAPTGIRVLPLEIAALFTFRTKA